MRMRKFLLLFSLLACPMVRSQDVAIVNANLFDGTGSPMKSNVVVLIRDKKIVAVGESGHVQLPKDCQVINAQGKYVIPGLIDTNVHLVLSLSPEWLAKYEGHFDQIISEAAQTDLKNGVTTVFDSWGPLQPLLDVRGRIRSGELLASRVYVAGNIVGLSGPLGRDFKNAIQMSSIPPAFAERINKLWQENVGPELLDDTVEEVRDQLRTYVTRGEDFVKFAESAHTPTAPENGWLMFSPEVASTIVAEAHKAGLPVQTHTQTIESLRIALAAGIDMAQHPEMVGSHELPDDIIQRIAERHVYCGVIAYKNDRLSAMKESWLSTGGRSGPWSPNLLDHWQTINIGKLIRSGALITMSTDSGLRDPDFSTSGIPKSKDPEPLLLGTAHFLWLEAMVEKGMTPMQTIMSATRNGAAAYRLLDQFGTIEPGKFADLLVLEDNPLANISNVRKIFLVMKEGRIIDRNQLPTTRLIQ
jgi:imidazolonepropionase-like amidohydrolase